MKMKSNGKSRRSKASFSHSKSKPPRIISEVCKDLIRDPVMRRQTVAFIKAVDGKKIRNTSGV